MSTSTGVIRELAAYTVREALRGRFAWILGAEILLALLSGVFLSQVAITEQLPALTAFAAALMRLGGVITLVLLVASCVVREQGDRSLDLLLALPVPRAALLLGRLSGFLLCAAGVALVSALALAPWASPAGVAAWGLSMLAECVLMTCVTLFFVSGLGNLGIAVIGALGFYTLARALAALALIAQAQIATTASTADRVLNSGLGAAAWVVPRLDLLTQSSWLVGYAVDWPGIAWAGTQALLISALCVVAALFDLYRREF